MYVCQIWDSKVMFFGSCLQNIIFPILLTISITILFLTSIFKRNFPQRIYVQKYHDLPFLFGECVLTSVLIIYLALAYSTEDNTSEEIICSSLFLTSSIFLFLIELIGVRGFVVSFKSIIITSSGYFICAFIPFLNSTILLANGKSITLWNYFAFPIATLSFLLAVFSFWCKPLSFQYELFSQPLNVIDGVNEKPPPEMGVSFFSLVTFSWVSDLIRNGYKRSLYYEDLPSLHPNEIAGPLYIELEDAWKKEFETKPHGKRSLLKIFARIHWKTFALSTVFKTIYDILLFTGPILLNKLINFIENFNRPDFNTPTYFGYIYAAILGLASLAQTCFLHQYFHRQMRLGIRLRSATISMIYSKALKIPHGMAGKIKPDGNISDQEAKSSGEIVNLMAVDSQRILDLMTYVQILWSGPFQILIAMILLFLQLGFSAFGGLLVAFMMIPLSGLLSKRIKKNQNAIMKKRDERLKIINETLGCIRILKMMAWEDSFKNMIDDRRETELNSLWTSQILFTLSRLQWNLAPMMVSFVAFIIYVLMGNDLTAAKAFTTISLVNILRFPMQLVPNMINSLMEALVSITRIQNFLEIPELKAIEIKSFETNDEHLEPIVEVSNLTSEWFNQSPLLKDLSFKAYKGQLIAIVGATGSGKSGFLYNLIGDTRITSGNISIKGSISYSCQVPWVQNCSVKDNICFKKEYNEYFYKRVIKACALNPDLDVLPAGDNTEIGERGINLSGGQKQRIALARSIYHDADIYIFDDCFSAIDANVAKQIFRYCFLDILKDKTVILVTHKLDLLPYFDKIVFIQDQMIRFCGPYAELQNLNFFKDFSSSQIISEHQTQTSHSDPTNGVTDVDSQSQNSITTPEAEITSRCESDNEANSTKVSSPLIPPYESSKKSKKSITNVSSKSKSTKNMGSITSDEQLLHGKVPYSVYWKYIKNCSLSMVFYFMLSLALYSAMQALSSFWLSHWTNPYSNTSPTSGIAMFGILSFSQVAFSICYMIFLSVAAQNSAIKFHRQLLEGIMNAPLNFFDTTPIGRILNRFSKDTNVIDEELPTALMSYALTIFTLLVVIVSISIAVPLFLIGIVALGTLYYYCQLYYIPTSRQLQRLDSVLRSPIFANFSETLEGAQTIRAFQYENTFKKTNEYLLDTNLKAYYMRVASNRWLAIRLETIGTAMVTVTALLIVLNNGFLAASLAGLAITYSLSVTQSLTNLVRVAGNIESSIVSVERIKEYSTDIEKEPNQKMILKHQHQWPSKGSIRFVDFSLRYRPELPLVLKSINLEILPGEKIGIVGRTGAGKSSLITAFLRLTETVKGTIIVDGVEIKNLNIHFLRSKFCLIPQSPSLFAGTLRFNIDPLGRSSDDEIMKALKKAHIYDHVMTLQEEPLSYVVDEGGKNFSVGQRQMICLARAIINFSKIVLLDEATSVVDPQTDNLIQKTIREEFAQSTILTIAHRIHTILNSDRILVIDNGQVHAFNTPEVLFDQKGSIFREMCLQSGVFYENGEFYFDNSKSYNELSDLLVE